METLKYCKKEGCRQQITLISSETKKKKIGYKLIKVNNRRRRVPLYNRNEYCKKHSCWEGNCYSVVNPVYEGNLDIKEGYGGGFCKVHSQCQFDKFCQKPRSTFDHFDRCTGKEKSAFCFNHSCPKCNSHILCLKHFWQNPVLSYPSKTMEWYHNKAEELFTTVIYPTLIKEDSQIDEIILNLIKHYLLDSFKLLYVPAEMWFRRIPPKINFC